MKVFPTRQAAILLTLVVCLSVPAQRIRVQGNKFLVGENPIFMLGANTPWNNWNDFGNNFNAGWWSSHFAEMHRSGLNCTRVWISCDGQNASPGISGSGTISESTGTFWNHVTQLFQTAQTNEIYVMIALISFDHSKEGNRNANAWRAMYKSAQNRQSFVDNYVIPFLRKFGDNPYFWSIDLGNELDWVHENDGVPIADVFDLLARVANAVHDNSEVLITLGTGAGPKYLSPTYGTNYYSDAELQKLQPGAYIDFYDNHYYDWMMEWFSSPFLMGPEDWQIDDKPCLIGEYSANGVDGLRPADCLQKAHELGWLGVMPWTSNGVDGNGSLSSFGSAFKSFADAHSDFVFPPDHDNPGPFTLTVSQRGGGSISVDPVEEQYAKGTTVTLTAIPEEGKELVKWSGDATGSSDTVELTMTRNMDVSAQFGTAGELIRNGTFENGSTAWNLGKYEGGSATGTVTDKGYRITINNGGNEEWHVQLLQAGLSLESGVTYEFSFDAVATADRSISVAVGEASGDFTKYLKQEVDFTTGMEHFLYTFTSTATTSNARVEFNLGSSNVGVTLDNISMRKEGDVTVRNLVTGAPDVTNIVYNPVTRTLQVRGIAEDMLIEVFSVSGKRLFSRTIRSNAGINSIAIDRPASQLLFVRGTAKSMPPFTKRVICGR